MAEITTADSFEDIDLQRPFQGLQAFGEKNKSQFGGRDAEINELFLLTKNNPLTIVFGKSGIGKTSVLQAGLMPELQKKSFFPVYFRIDFAGTKPPLTQLKDFIYEKLKSKDQGISEFENRTLWEYFHDIKLSGGKVIPVLILDQFEEIFTIGKDKSSEVTELITQLSDMAENRVPATVYAEYQKRDELLPSHYERQPYRVIIGLREDYLAQLESLKKYLPSIQKSRCRILQMTALQAMQSVLKSAGALIEIPIAKEIIKKLPGITELDFEEFDDDSTTGKRLLIEPFLLSLICFQINEKRIELVLEKFTPELVSGFEIKDVINSFYSDALKNCNENVQIGIEDSLLTESGYRKLASLEELQSKYAINDVSIETLINKRLIRQEEREGVDYVELIHDILVPVIKEKRESRIKDKLEKERQEAIQKTIDANRLKIKKIRNRSIVAGIIVLIAFSLISLYAYTKNAEATRLKNVEFARKLLIVSNSAENNYGDVDGAALISRTAYLIYKENDGKDFNNFYMNMYDKMKTFYLTYSKEHFLFFASNDTVQSIAVKNEYFYSGYISGKILKTRWTDSIAQPESFYDLKNVVTSMSVSSNKNNLAVAGWFPFVQLFDLDKKDSESIKLKIPFENGKSNTRVLFTENDNLLVFTDSTLAGWKNNANHDDLIWNKKQFDYTGGKYISSDSIRQEQRIHWNSKSLSIPGVAFTCMAVYKDMIAIGIDSGFVLINNDSLVKYKLPVIGTASSIQFSNQGDCIYIGNTTGMFCKVNLKDLNIEINLNQAGDINEMILSNGNNLIATKSDDDSPDEGGLVGIFDLNNKETWQNSIPLLLSLPKPCAGTLPPKLKSIAFSADNKYVLAGYDNGEIYRWPASVDVLSNMICDKINLSLDSVWGKYVGKENSTFKLNRYACGGAK